MLYNLFLQTLLYFIYVGINEDQPNENKQRIFIQNLL